MPNLKIVLIGCGRIAQLVHLRVLTNLSGVELAAIAESDPERREEAAVLAPKAVVLHSYHELLKMRDLQAVVICLPPALHAETAIASFHAGKHVYLEKPIATNLADAHAIVEAWRKAGTVGMMGFNYRFNEFYQSAKQYILSGRLGNLVAVRTVFSSAAHELPAWKRTRQDGGGALLDLASHHLDLIRFLFGLPIEEVSGRIRSQHSECDSAILQMRLTDDLLIQSFFSIGSVDEDRFEIYGKSGKLMLDRYAGDLKITAPEFEYGRLSQISRELSGVTACVKRILNSPGEQSFSAALRAFVSAASENQTKVSPDLDDGYYSLAVIEAAEESARTGRTVIMNAMESF